MRRAFSLIVLTILLAHGSSAGPALAGTSPSWVRAWTSSLWEAKPEQRVAIDRQTIRASLRVGAAGSAIRIRLANDFASEPLRIGAVRVTTERGRSARVLFNSKTGGLIASDAPLLSDAVDVPVSAFESITISVYIDQAVALTSIHADRGDQTMISVRGDFTAAAVMPGTTMTATRPLLAGVDVLASTTRPVIVAFGDSITDNAGCSIDGATMCSWPDVLARRLSAARMRHVVVNQGIGGNRLVTRSTGPNAQARFDRDVLAIPGVSHVVILEGINDIRAAATTGVGAPELIDSYRQLIARAHEHGIKVIGMTVLPFGGNARYSDASEAVRQAVNNWIRTAGMFDAIVDLDAVVRDPANPQRLLDAYDSGDHLHPNARGEIAMGAAISLLLFM